MKKTKIAILHDICEAVYLGVFSEVIIIFLPVLEWLGVRLITNLPDNVQLW